MKGFFSFIAIFAMLLLLLITGIILNHSENRLVHINNILIKTEIASSQRTLLENSVDKIILYKLREQVKIENFNIINAKNEINNSLTHHLHGKASATNILLKKTGEVTADYLNDSSAVTILRTNELTYAEYSFSSNELKTNNVSTKIGEEITLYYKIPIGYSARVIQ